MDAPTNNDKMIFYHKTQRGNFRIELAELETEIREAHQDIRIKFSINIKNESHPEWKIKINDTRGRISKIEDKEKLIEKLKNEIKIRINKDEQNDNINIGESTLDLT